MNKAIRSLTTIALLASYFIAVPHAAGDSLDPCRVKSSANQSVSLGFPIKPERLVHLDKPRVLVIPFRLKDEPNYSFTEKNKFDYLQAGKNISSFSAGKNNIDFIFSPTVDSNLSNQDLVELKSNQQSAWMTDISKSTWGFIRKFIADYDSQIDFKGINAVVIEGSSSNSLSGIAEAMMFETNSKNSWYEPIQTAEGKISNVILMDKHKDQNLITHELMHLYGLTDLYGSDTGPGRLSVMATQVVLALLTYEKWVLGWHPDVQVQCIQVASNSTISKLILNYSQHDQLVVIRSISGTTYIAETSSNQEGKLFAFYSLNNEDRPPITLYQTTRNFNKTGIDLGSINAIGKEQSGPEFSTIISDIDSSILSISLFSSALGHSSEVNQLRSQAAESKSRAEKLRETLLKREADEKAAKEEKAKQETEAKSAVDLKAKQEAEVAMANKKTTITCVKGKTIKKVLAVKPKCPTGFKRK